MLAWASVMAAVVCLGWCLVVGVLIWTTPVAGSVVEITMDSEGTRTIEERIEERSFSDTSGLGIVPLVIPVLLAGWALWAAWWRRITAPSRPSSFSSSASLLGFRLAARTCRRGWALWEQRSSVR